MSEVITVEIFQKLCSFIHSASSGWNFEPASSAFIQLRQNTLRHNVQISRLFCPILWSGILIKRSEIKRLDWVSKPLLRLWFSMLKRDELVMSLRTLNKSYWAAQWLSFSAVYYTL